MKKRLIIFAGAGASRGVSLDKYPMALDFRKRLPEQITVTPLYGRLNDHLVRLREAEKVDIEHLLWELGRLVEAIDEWTGDGLFASNLLQTNHIASITGHQNSGQQTHGQFLALKEHAVRLQNQINEQIYNFYAQAPTKDELLRSWLPVLQWAASTDFEFVDLITTNYDLILEHALRSVPALRVDTGLAQDVLPVINLDRWDAGRSTSGLLTKLHGSVDWKLGNGGTADRPVIRQGHPEFDGDHAKRLILYPGFKGRPDRQPFIAFHDYFKRQLTEATHLLFIGFAFRDEFINEIVATSTPATTRIAVVDPISKLPNISFLQRATHLRQAFGNLTDLTQAPDDALLNFSIQDVIEWAT